MIKFCEEKMGAKMFGMFLCANDQCNGCGRCITHCPSHNISFGNDQIKFSHKCYMCMRCIYSCPEKAIEAKRLKFFVLKKVL